MRIIPRAVRRLAPAFALVLALSSHSRAQSWQTVTNHPSFSPSTALLMTNGTVLVQATNGSQWWRLTPDNTGSYVNGTWSTAAALPPGYTPLYYGSAVLADGRVVIMGGEYNGSNSPVWTNKGAIYNPATNKWTALAPPTGWSQIGDAQSVVLRNGKWMLADPFNTNTAILDPSTLTWTIFPGAGKADRNDEEGWTLLPDNSILTVDAQAAPGSERYLPSQHKWVSAGSTIVRLEDPTSQEIGPAVLRPDGTVFATGACAATGDPGPCGSPGHTAIYTLALSSSTDTEAPGPGTWAAGPNFPNGLDIADGPAALLPSGNVLMATSPGVFLNGVKFFEFDGSALSPVPDVPNAGSEPSYSGRMLILPTGQILWTDGTSDVEIYTPAGSPNPAWAPTITSAPATVNRNTSYTISGTQFNGLSQGAAYGDDAQAATNYPLVRIVNNSSGHVFYCKTHNHSTMGVATGAAIVSTTFNVPNTVELGPSNLYVVANGIASNPQAVTVNAAPGQ